MSQFIDVVICYYFYHLSCIISLSPAPFLSGNALSLLVLLSLSLLLLLVVVVVVAGVTFGRGDLTVSFHNFKTQIFKSSVSNPKSKYVA